MNSVFVGYCINQNQKGFDNYECLYPGNFYCVEKVQVARQKTKSLEYCEVFFDYVDTVEFVYKQRGRNLINPYTREVINLKSFWNRIKELDGINPSANIKQHAANGIKYKYPSCCIINYCEDIRREKKPDQLRGFYKKYVPCEKCKKEVCDD